MSLLFAAVGLFACLPGEYGCVPPPRTRPWDYCSKKEEFGRAEEPSWRSPLPPDGTHEGLAAAVFQHYVAFSVREVAHALRLPVNGLFDVWGLPETRTSEILTGRSGASVGSLMRVLAVMRAAQFPPVPSVMATIRLLTGWQSVDSQ